MIINRATDAQAADLLARIRGGAVTKPKRATPGKKQYCNIVKVPPSATCGTYVDGCKWWSITVPLGWDSRLHQHSCPDYVRREFKKAHKAAVFAACHIHLGPLEHDQGARDAIVQLTFLRYGPGVFAKKDNLPSAFKNIVDATAAFLRWGPECESEHNQKIIGRADDWLEARGVDWSYDQMPWPENRSCHGARITLIARAT